MGIPNITTNLSGFGCFMEDLLETPEDYGCYIVDRRGQGVEESVNELVSLLSFSILSSPLISLQRQPDGAPAIGIMRSPSTTLNPHPWLQPSTPTYHPHRLDLRPRLRVLMIDQPTPLLRQQVPTTTYQPAKPN